MEEIITAQRVEMVPALDNHIEKLEEVRIDIGYIGEWMSRSHRDVDIPIEHGLDHGFSVPLGYHSKDYIFRCVQIMETKKVIGYVGLLPNYPQEKSLTISMVALKQDYHRMGLGSEIVKAIEENFKGSGFSNIEVPVDIKNWPALRFFNSLGFSKIKSIPGDEIFANFNFSKIVLEKALE